MILQIAEPLGANRLFHGQLAGTGESVTVSLSGVHQIDPGRESRRFSVHPDHIHLLIPQAE